MKIIQISNNIKINIELIYSLEHRTNQSEINEWDNEYQRCISEFSEEPPLLPISDEELYKPVYGEENDTEKMQLYANALSTYINSIIGEKPILEENYIVILSTGLKINVDKFIYDKLNKALEKYIDK